MSSRKPFNALKVAWIGIIALLASPAWAVIDLDAGEDSVTYAKETLTSATTQEGEDGNTYYTVTTGATDPLTFQAAVGFGGVGVDVEVLLHGMAFTSTSAPTLTMEAAAVCPITAGDAFTRKQDGAAGDHRAAFSTGSEAVLSDTLGDSSIVCLYLTNVGVSASRMGGVTFNIYESGSGNFLGEKSVSHSGAVSVVKGLMPGGENIDPMALVSSSFLSFDTGQRATVGKFDITPVMGILNADGNETMLEDLISLANPISIANVVGNGESTVVFTGNFSFATKVMLLETTAACTDEDVVGDQTPFGTARMEAVDLMMDGEDADTSRLQTQSVGYARDKFLCIVVAAADSEDAVAIPETSPYVARKTLLAGTDGAAFPPGMVTHPLGRIIRDGTTVRLPYLTQFATYNQRIIIRNRGGAAPYSFTFHTEDGITATRGTDAEGMLEANSVTVISMMFGDLVTIDGTHNRTAATLVVEAEKSDIDVSVSQTNMDGGTDTTHLTETDR